MKLERVKLERVKARRTKADVQRYVAHQPLFAGMDDDYLASEMLPLSVRQSANVRR